VGIHQLHHEQVVWLFLFGAVIKGGSADTQKITLPADAHFGLWIDQQLSIG
jgi:hypothetical protein